MWLVTFAVAYIFILTIITGVYAASEALAKGIVLFVLLGAY